MFVPANPCSWSMRFHVDPFDKSMANSIVSWIVNSILNSKSPPPFLLISLSAGPISKFIYIYIYVWTHVHMYKYIYIYIERERERCMKYYHYKNYILYPMRKKHGPSNALFRCNLNYELCIKLPFFYTWCPKTIHS